MNELWTLLAERGGYALAFAIVLFILIRFITEDRKESRKVIEAKDQHIKELNERRMEAAIDFAETAKDLAKQVNELTKNLFSLISILGERKPQ